MKKSDIILVEYNGAGRPFQVFTKENETYIRGYDFFMKDGYIQCDWMCGGMHPYIHPRIKISKPRKLFFLEEYRPCSTTSDIILDDHTIASFGFTRINNLIYADEIIEALHNH